MAVFRVERTRDYTVMCNHHLKDSNLSLKAKGLLSMMLSLPDEWNYTTRGLATICKEGVDAIGKTLKELELAGYIIRRQLRGKDGRISDTEYTLSLIHISSTAASAKQRRRRTLQSRGRKLHRPRRKRFFNCK